MEEKYFARVEHFEIYDSTVNEAIEAVINDEVRRRDHYVVTGLARFPDGKWAARPITRDEEKK